MRWQIWILALVSILAGFSPSSASDLPRPYPSDSAFCCVYQRWLLSRSVFNRVLGRSKQVLALCDAAVRLNPRDPWALGWRGWIHYDLDQNKEALADFGEALRLDPKAAWVYYNRACVFHEENDYERVMADCSDGHSVGAAGSVRSLPACPGF